MRDETGLHRKDVPVDLPNFSDRLIYTVPAGTGELGELLANREWRICADPAGPRVILTSLNGEQVWDGPVFESPWSPDEPPGPSTGVHGLKNRYRRGLVKQDWDYGRRTWAWGWVALSGLVEEYDLGFRAERAAIRQLRLGPRALAHFGSRDEVRDLIAQLEDRYQCEVKIGCPEWRVSRTMFPAVPRGQAD
jgi:hypothetical protein